MALRLRGSETEIRVTRAGVLQDTITKVANFEFEAKIELTEDSFLGSSTNEYDETYNGCSFDFEVQLDTADWLDFQKGLENKARRITPDVVYSIAAVLSWPNGTTRALVIPDAHFGAVPISVGGKNEFVTSKCSGGASEYFIQNL
jgi:hypothetical protein